MQTEAIQAFSVNTLIGRGIREKNDLSATSRFHVRAAVGSCQKELAKNCPHITLADGTSRALDLNR